MDSILQSIEDWFRELLVSGIMNNLTNTFDSVNNQVGQIATEVGRTPANFSPAVYNMIRTLSENVIMPIAGLILTFIACYELIQLVISHNNLANFETWIFWKWIFKTFVAVTLITNTMNITMAVFDVAQHVVSQAGGIIGSSTAIDASTLATMQSTLEATLAQNESKKISQRVKAGQMISFKNGVLYGNGNILGYDRVDGNLVINKEQAETVKRIFELYLDGNGVRKIQDIMEQEGRKTASGLTRWQAGNINRVLGNSFYCGRIEYRKQYVPDYLTQKKINNHGEIEKIYVEGSHEAIITPEVFDEAQRLKEKRSTVKKDEHGNIIRKGQSPCKNVWAAKCRCTCGHAMNRRLAHKSKTGDTSFIFQCYGQLRTGTPAMRLKRGLDIEGICDNTTFMQWRLDIMADFIFKKLITNRQAIYDEAIAMAGDLLEVRMTDGSSDKDKVENNIKQIDKLKKQIAVLVDMCTEGDISREVFRQKKQKLEDQIINLEKTNNECKQQILESEDDKLKQRRIESLTEFIKMQAFDPRAKIPETMIDVFVDRIVYDKGVFSWYLNPKLGNETFKVDTTDWKKSMLKSQKKTLPAHNSTGSYRQRTLIDKTCIFVGTFEIPKDYMKKAATLYYKDRKLRFPEKLDFKLFLV